MRAIQGEAAARRAVVVAVVLLAAGCGARAERTSSDAGRDRAHEPAAAAPSEARRLDLTVVSLTARIGRDTVSSSGAVLDAERGLVLTSAHSLWGATSLKVTTGLGVLHGRIVARNACDDMALVETQPRLPGLVAIGPDRGRLAPGVAAVALHRSSGRVMRLPVRRDTRERGLGETSIAPAAVRLRGRLPLAATGSPVVDADGRLLGILALGSAGRSASGTDAPAGAAPSAALVPARTIDARLGELSPGEGTVFVGWRRHYACAGRLDAHAAANHPGYRERDARLNAPVTVSRLPGSEVPGG
jgi:hypothetical protein